MKKFSSTPTLTSMPKPTSTSTFHSFIETPILNLDADFVITPSKREQAPLPKKPAAASSHGVYDAVAVVDADNNAGPLTPESRCDTAAGSRSTAPANYADTLRHALLHETFHGIGKDFDERDKKFGKIAMTVSAPTAEEGRWFIFQCAVPVDVIVALTSRMKAGKRKGKGGKKQEDLDADFFIKESSVGIIMEENGKPTLALIQHCDW